jgi:molecular chaperone DnaJ
MPDDYYEILGVDEDATREEIRSAYRRRAKECHPDCSEVGNEPFRQVHKAYEVLSDPNRRRVYDREQRPDAFAVPVRRWTRTGPVRPSRAPVEPLSPRPHTYGTSPSFFDRYFASPYDSVLDDLWGGFATGSATRSAPRELEIEVHLSPAQAREGGTFRVELTIPAVCPSCYGEGWAGPYRCHQCDGQGAIATQRPLRISYPSGIKDGDVGRMSLAGVGLPGSDLLARFHVRSR